MAESKKEVEANIEMWTKRRNEENMNLLASFVMTNYLNYTEEKDLYLDLDVQFIILLIKILY